VGKPPTADDITIKLGEMFFEDRTDGMPQDRVTFSAVVTVLVDLKIRLRHGQLYDTI
jgi:hypothetical protein